MRLAGVGAIALAIACHGGSAGQSAPAGNAPPGGSGPPPGVPDVTCLGRAFTFGDLPTVEGAIPCYGGFCIENAPPQSGDAFLAGERGALWAIGDGMFLRQDGERWISVCPPSGFGPVSAVHGLRGDDLWIGDERGRLLHWDGLAWTPTPSPAAGHVSGLWGGAREAFASVGGALLRWDGTAWRDTGARGTRPWGDGAGRAWALAGSVLEWDGARWRPVAGIPADVTVTDVWSPPGGDLWVAGTRPHAPPAEPWNGPWAGFGPAVLRREAGAFVDTGVPSEDGSSPSWIRGASASDVWIPFREGVALHWDGAGWTPVQRGGDLWASRPHVLSDGTALLWSSGLLRLDGAPAAPAIDAGAYTFSHVGAAGPGDVWLGGSEGLWRLEGRGFRQVDSRPITALAVRSGDDVWALSGDDLLHWDGERVERIVPEQGPGEPWWSRGIASAGPGRVWVAEGSDWRGWTMWRFGGGEREAIPVQGLLRLTAIASGPDGDLWAIGPDALAANTTVVMRRAGDAWERTLLRGRVLSAIAVAGRNDVWASGREPGCRVAGEDCPIALHFDGSAWSAMGRLAARTFAPRAPDEVWAIEERFAGVWRWDGRAWTEVPGAAVPVGLAVTADGDVWGAMGHSVVHRRAAAGR